MVSIAELYEGVFWSPKPEEKEIFLLDFLEGFTAINLSRPIARFFGKKRAELRGKGVTVNNFDLLIACTAEYHKLTILTILLFAGLGAVWVFGEKKRICFGI